MSLGGHQNGDDRGERELEDRSMEIIQSEERGRVKNKKNSTTGT